MTRLRNKLPSWILNRVRSNFLLTTFTLLLIMGAAFIVLGWFSARNAAEAAYEADTRRLTRNANTVLSHLNVRYEEMDHWISRNRAKVKAQARDALQTQLDHWIVEASVRMVRARIVFDGNGQLLAIGEHRKGSLYNQPVWRDVKQLAELTVRRNERMVSNCLSIRRSCYFAIATPVKHVSAEDKNFGVVVTIYVLTDSALASFLESANGDPVDLLSLVDAENSVIGGAHLGEKPRTLEREIQGTPWRLVAIPQKTNSLVPQWSYLVFALVLIMLAIAYALQEYTRRRFKRISSERVRQVRALYELASSMLNASSQLDQREELLWRIPLLLEVDSVKIDLFSPEEEIHDTQIDAIEEAYSFSIAIIGPHGQLGELSVSRASSDFDYDERSVVQAISALAGAAMHTSVTMEAERSSAAELQRLDELRSNLLGTVAHELRSPVTAVKGVLDLLSMQTDLDERTRSYVDVATERTEHLVALIQDLFDCSLLETGQMDIRPQRQTAAELLHSVLGAEIAANPRTLTISVDDSLKITVDPVRFDQIMSNLVTNAFTHGRPPVEVAVHAKKLDDVNGVEVTVTDRGDGIQDGISQDIFEKFWQGSSGNARLVQGAGLGLSLVSGLVKLHGGKISVESPDDGSFGTRFVLWLPDTTPHKD